MRGKIHNIPDRIQLIDPALFDVVRQPRVTTIKMAQRAICIASKNRNCRILISFAILAAEIVFESAFGGAQETQPVPSSVSRMRAQRGGIGSSDDRQINVLVEMVSDSIEAVDPR